MVVGHLRAHQVNVQAQAFRDLLGRQVQGRQVRHGSKLFLETPLPLLFNAFFQAFFFAFLEHPGFSDVVYLQHGFDLLPPQSR